MKLILICALILTSCASQGRRNGSVVQATRAQACEQIHSIFKKDSGLRNTGPDAVNECHMRVIASERRFYALNKYFDKNGWRRDETFGKGQNPSKASWESVDSRCTIDQTIPPPEKRIRGSVGVSGGSSVSTGIGVGVGIGGTDEIMIDYKVDCSPKALPG